MSDDIGKFPPQRGHSWRGDWEQRVKDLLARRACASLSEFFARSPTSSVVELANELGPGDVAGVQLQWMAIDEAVATNRMEQLARDLLVRSLHSQLPDGWINPASGRDRLAMALSDWTSSITSRVRAYRPTMMAMAQAMLDENPFPDGWLPASPDDPLIVAFFERCWRAPRSE